MMGVLLKSLMLLVWTTMAVEGNKAAGDDVLNFTFPGVPPMTIVEIINNLTNPTQDLTVHCKSKNDDLKEHTIVFRDKYTFRFRPNILSPTTLFFCSFRWPADTSLHHFDIYVQTRDQDTCVERHDHENGVVAVCSWTIWQRGACKYDIYPRAYTDCYPWDHPPATATVGSSSSNSSLLNI